MYFTYFSVDDNISLTYFLDERLALRELLTLFKVSVWSIGSSVFDIGAFMLGTEPGATFVAFFGE